MKVSSKKSKIHIVSLGGTIVSRGETPTEPFYSSPSLALTNILDSIPELLNIATVECETLANISSHEISNDLLFTLAQRLQILANDAEVQGIVVSQGTNSLEEVAYFMNLVLQTAKPIIFTGAMKPASALGYEGTRNLYNAIALAVSAEAWGKGVLLTFNDSIVGARDAAKLNATIVGNFAGNDLGLLGYMHAGMPHFYRSPVKKHTLHSEFTLQEIKTFPPIFILYGHLAADDFLAQAVLAAPGVRGIVSAGLGSGYQSLALTTGLAQASQNGIIVVRCARSGQGVVWRDAHTDDKYGFIAGDSLTAQKARILLAVALSKTSCRQEIQRIFTAY